VAKREDKNWVPICDPNHRCWLAPLTRLTGPRIVKAEI
jgi:hypothetical protein